MTVSPVFYTCYQGLIFSRTTIRHTDDFRIKRPNNVYQRLLCCHYHPDVLIGTRGFIQSATHKRYAMLFQQAAHFMTGECLCGFGAAHLPAGTMGG